LAKTKINSPIDIYLIIRTAKRRTFGRRRLLLLLLFL
jgi:hypothetical protein